MMDNIRVTAGCIGLSWTRRRRRREREKEEKQFLFKMLEIEFSIMYIGRTLWKKSIPLKILQ